MNWASASLMANVDKIILEKGYGCEVELVAGATMPTFTSMNEKGAPDVAPELMGKCCCSAFKKAVGENRLIVANKVPITGLGEGWWLSPYTAKKHPILKQLQMLLLDLIYFHIQKINQKVLLLVVQLVGDVN